MSILKQINMKSPIISSMVIILATFIASSIVIYCAKPTFVKSLNTENEIKVDPIKVFVYSLLIACVVGITIFFGMVKVGNSSHYSLPEGYQFCGMVRD